MTFPAKLISLASADPVLQGIFGTSPMRLFDRQLAQTYYAQGVCCSFRVISTPPRIYTQYGLMALSQPRVQFDVRASPRYVNGATEATRAAKAALIAWLGTVSFSDPNDFNSPPTTPPHAPNFVLNEREGMDFQLEPPVYVESFDVRIWNSDN